MITLQVTETVTPDFDLLLLEQAALTALQQAGISPESDITIVLTDDEQLQQMNKHFLDIDAPTDVLSFSADFIDPDTDSPYLGDILISNDRAKAQAAAGGHTIQDEVQLLVVHGVLHLLGYDHLESEDKTEMWALQAEVLDALGISLSPP